MAQNKFCICNGSLESLVVTKAATNWEVLERTGFESHWGRISVAVVYLTMLNLLTVGCRGAKGGVGD